MLLLVSFVLSDSSCEQHKESEDYKMKNYCPQRDSNPLSLAILDWRANRLSYRVRSDCGH